MAKSEKQRRLGVTLGALGAGAAAYAGLGSRLAELAYLRRNPDYSVPATTSLSRDLLYGSGEGRMTGNFVDRINHGSGVRSFFVNSSQPAEIYPANAHVIASDTLSASDMRKIRALADIPADKFVPHGNIAGVPDSLWKNLMNRVDATGLRGKFLVDLASGKFDGYRMGELTDNIHLLGKDAITGKVPMKPWSNIGTRELFNRHKGAFIGERGMAYSSVPWVSPESVLGSTELGEGGPRNVAFDVGWGDNYTTGSKKLIPFSKVDSSIWNRSDVLAEVRRRVYRRRLEQFIRSQGGNPAGRKILYFSGGSANPLGESKARMVLEALERAGLKDKTHLVMQVGGGTLTGGSAYNPTGPAYFGSLPKDHLTLFERTDMRNVPMFINGADANIGYGGSSTLTELMGTRTPVTFLSDSPLNRSNIDFARRVFGESAVGAERYDMARWLSDRLANSPANANFRSELARAFRSARDYNPFGWEDRSRFGNNIRGIFRDLKSSGGFQSRDAAIRGLRGMMDKEVGDLSTHLSGMLAPGARRARAPRVKNMLKLQNLRNAQTIRQLENYLLLKSGPNSIPLKYKLPAAAVAAGIAGLGLHHATKKH